MLSENKMYYVFVFMRDALSLFSSDLPAREIWAKFFITY